MIYTDSRYATGKIMYTADARSGNENLSVYRIFPTLGYRFSAYVWGSEDRIDKLAAEVLGSSSLWWKIMDLNPEIVDPSSIAPGTTLRIPSV